MSHIADKEHKAPQPDPDPHFLTPYLHDNHHVEFTTPMGISPFLIIFDTHNMDVVSCEVSNSKSCENTEQLKENDHREYTHVLKEEVLEDDELHACRRDLDQIEDDGIKDDIS